MYALMCFSYLLISCSIVSASDLTKNAKALIDMGMGNTYFMRLPDELHDHIAYFIEFDDRETDEEFIDRASELKEIDPKYQDRIRNIKLVGSKSFHDSGLLSYSVDRKTIYRFREDWIKNGGIRHESPVKSFDLTTENFFCKALSHFNRAFGFPLKVHCFAISRTEKECAQLIESDTICDDDSQYKQYSIICRNGEEKPYYSAIISRGYWCFTSIGFNKQSTKIILFAHQIVRVIEAKSGPVISSFKPCSLLFPLVSEAEHEKVSKKTLVGYFAQLIEKHTNNMDVQ